MPDHNIAWTKTLKYIKKKFPSRLLCQRIFKSTLNSTIALIMCLNPKTRSILGDEPAMLPLISVIVHPGRRLGTIIEAIFLCSSGLLLGNAWCALGRYSAQQVTGPLGYLDDQDQFQQNYINYRAALAVLAVFEMIMLFFHGWMRAISHKFFAMVFPLFLVVHFTFVADINISAYRIFKDYTVPFFLGIGMSFAINLLVFPEFGSSYLGRSMIQTLNEVHATLDSTVQFFITVNKQESFYSTPTLGMAQLSKKKTLLRSKLNSTEAVLQECTYELSYSYLSPAEVKPIIEHLKLQLSYLNALINASQLQFGTLLERDENKKLLYEVLSRTEGPIYELEKVVSKSLYIIKASIAHAYDVKAEEVKKSPSFELEDIDVKSIDFDANINALAKAMAQFDLTFRKELLNLSSEYEHYFSPNDDMFLLSSFLMNLKEVSNSVCNVMKETQKIHASRERRETRGLLGRRIWLSFLTSTDQLKGWFVANRNVLAGGNETSSLNGDIQSMLYVGDDARKDEKNRGIDEEFKPKEESTITDSYVSKLLRFYEHFKPNFRFGFQITVGLMLASFPMFVPESRQWYVEYRGAWIAFVCILVLEPEIGSTFWVFFLRGVGVISGAAWGYLSYVSGIHQTNPYLEVVITIIGAVPGFYFFLGTPFVKAAIIGIISIYIVLLSSAIPSDVGGSILVNFAKRCLAMIYGGVVALICQLLFFPIKARDELIKEVAYSTGSISKLVLLYASGLDGEDVKLSLSQVRFDAFTKLSASTQSALIRADSYRKSAKQEPRLKGSYGDIEKIFFEIIFILREIVDRINNIVHLRRVYGSAIIEEFNLQVHPYRRQLSASLSNSFKAVELALLTKTPLPQYVPSPKIAHERLVEKVREVIREKYKKARQYSSESDSENEIVVNFRKRTLVNEEQQEKLLKAKFLSWNATSAATEEIISYIEELLELTRLLVGVNEFKYGFLSRSLYSEYAAKATRGYTEALGLGQVLEDGNTAGDDAASLESYDEDEEQPVGIVGNDDITSNRSGISNGFRKRVFSIGSFINGDVTSGKSIGEYSENDDSDDDNELPLSLMRVVSRKVTNNASVKPT